jgi:UDP-N-acetylmuramyl pentapeptide phosphotransferase/UDP-N-acetylglucosamine-1-phosphate transferase
VSLVDAVIVGVFAVAALLLTWVLWALGGPRLERARFQRVNYRGVTVVTAAGALAGVSAAAILVVLRWVAPQELVGDSAGRTSSAVAELVAAHVTTTELLVGAGLVLFFALLGLVDDVWASSSGGGFRGHLRTLRSGRITTGLVKLVAGGVAALIAAVLLRHNLDPWTQPLVFLSVLPDAALMALAANTVNLFDRAPLRAWKAAAFATAAIALVSAGEPGVVVAVITVFAAGGLLLSEARERLMQGDAGANALGVSVGVSAVISLSPAGRWITLGVLLALNLVSEWVSFTTVIDNSRFLRRLDRWGSPHRS